MNKQVKFYFDGQNLTDEVYQALYVMCSFSAETQPSFFLGFASAYHQRLIILFKHKQGRVVYFRSLYISLSLFIIAMSLIQLAPNRNFFIKHLHR